MANVALTGVVPVEINFSYCITCTSFSVRVNTPTTKKFGAFGVIGGFQVAAAGFFWLTMRK